MNLGFTSRSKVFRLKLGSISSALENFHEITWITSNCQAKSGDCRVANSFYVFRLRASVEKLIRLPALETIWRFFGFVSTQLISTKYFQLLNLKLTVYKLIFCLIPLYPDVQNSPFNQARTPHRTTNSTPRKTSPIADRFLVDHRKRVCRRRVTQRGIPLPYWRPCGRQSLELPVRLESVDSRTRYSVRA